MVSYEVSLQELATGLTANISYVFRISISAGTIEILMRKLILSGNESNLKFNLAKRVIIQHHFSASLFSKRHS